MLRIDIKNLTGKRIPPTRLLKKAIKKVLKLHKKTGGELNLIFLTDAQIKKLNLKYKKRNRPTDVLAFSMREGMPIKGSSHILGDIAISVDTAVRQAKIFNSSKKRELYVYVIHGVLHLLGYDDTSKEEFRSMQKKQNEILESIWNNLA